MLCAITLEGEKLINEDYFYRVDPEKRFNCIKDGFLRSVLWRPSTFPHKNLDAISKKNPGQDVYRVCFYDTEVVARDHIKEFSSHLHIKHGGGVKMLTRWPRNEPSHAGFTWSQDDGFVSGKASLFWVLEQHGGALSLIGIPLASAEVWDDARTQWVPLFQSYPSLNPSYGATPPTMLTVNPAGSTEVVQSGKEMGSSKWKGWLERFLNKLEGN